MKMDISAVSEKQADVEDQIVNKKDGGRWERRKEWVADGRRVVGSQHEQEGERERDAGVKGKWAQGGEYNL